jgi:predicted membrane protein
MSTLKEDVKDVGLALVFDLMLVFIILFWVLAIVLALLEVTLWVVFGVFLIGCGFFFAVLYFSKKTEEKEKLEKEETKVEIKEDDQSEIKEEDQSEIFD